LPLFGQRSAPALTPLESDPLPPLQLVIIERESATAAGLGPSWTGGVVDAGGDSLGVLEQSGRASACAKSA
jgi:hypothetical protein